MINSNSTKTYTVHVPSTPYGIGATDAECLLTVGDLARTTKESRAVWRKRVQRGDIAVVKLGRNVRVRRADLEKFIATRTIGAIE